MLFDIDVPAVDQKKIARDVKEIKSKTKVQLGKGKTIVVAVASSLDGELNKVVYIPCKNGIHVCNTVYDVTKDSFVVDAIDYYHIAEAPVHYFIEIDGVQGFRVHLPLPETVMKRYITESEKKEYDAWKAKYPKDLYSVKLIQMVTTQ